MSHQQQYPAVVDDYSSVTAVTNNSAPVTFSFNDEDGTFTANVALTYGTNTIEVTAEDLALNTATEKRTVTYDNLAPCLSVTEPPQDISTDQAAMTIQGEVSDLTITTVTISIDGGTPETLTVTDGLFEKTVNFTQEKTYVITVTAADELGNSSSVTRNIVYSFDRTPVQFSLTDQTGVALNTWVTSNTITVTGIIVPVPISITGGTYSVSTDGGATWSAFSKTAPATVKLNDKVKVQLASSTLYSTTTNATLTIGGVSDTFSVTTIAPYADTELHRSV